MWADDLPGVRFTPKATVGRQNAIGRYGPRCDMREDMHLISVWAELLELLARILVAPSRVAICSQGIKSALAHFCGERARVDNEITIDDHIDRRATPATLTRLSRIQNPVG